MGILIHCYAEAINMPPVEQSHVPRDPNVTRRKSITELKSVEKAMELPVVSDTLEELDKVKNTLSDYARVRSARQMVEEGMKILAENNMVKDGMKVLHNEKIMQTMTNVRDKVYPHVYNAVEHLDDMACGGLESLTTALPALSHPTPELVESTKETARNYFSLATEYLASFTVSRIGLSVADKSLDTVEKSVKFFKPDKKDEGVACRTYAKIRKMRRMLRALRRAGERRNYIEMDKLARAGMVGRLASFFSVNMMLHIFGLELVAVRPSRAHHVVDEIDADESHTELKDVQGNFVDYQSDEDPDYHPTEDEDSLDDSATSDESEDEAGESRGEEETHHHGEEVAEAAEEHH